MNPEQYFTKIEQEVVEAYAIARKARAKGLDPENDVSMPLAKNMAERVEGLVGAIVPQIIGSGVALRIQELEKQYGRLDLRVALTISLEIAKGKFCAFANQVKAMEAGIRVGLGYLTLGVVSSPLEGFVELKIAKRRDGKDYFCLMYSGPIRSAGGTAGALSVVVADYVRKQMGYDVYDPTEQELKRMATELHDYHERITNLQYLPSDQEIMFMTQHIPVQVNGDPSEKIDVSNYKDIPRIETNKIRSGTCLVMGECLTQKAPKINKLVSKIAKEFDLEHWNFLEEFLKLQKKVKAGDKKSDGDIAPVYTYIQDLVAGRPVLGHPLAPGGFRLRYGRCRTSGYSSTALHPATMHILNSYIGTGTQLKLERPGKATAVTVCDSIEGPIVRLNNGTVMLLEDEKTAKKLAKEIEEILFLGDILINYGDFFNRAHRLIPPGYCQEWWILEVEKAMTEKYKSLDWEQLAAATSIPLEKLAEMSKHPITTKLNAYEAIAISKELEVPLHPYYTYHWNLVSTEDFLFLVEHLMHASKTEQPHLKIIMPFHEKTKKILGNIGLEHMSINNEFIVIEYDHAAIILEIFSSEIPSGSDTKLKPLELLNSFAPFRMRDKSGIFIGSRMGRPEKAKMRKLTGNPHVLFPVGDEGGRLRSFQSALEAGKVTAEFSKEWLAKFKDQNLQNKVITDKEHYVQLEFDIKTHFQKILEKIGMPTYPDLIKGVRGTSNEDHAPEHLVKGILRAKHDVYVNKDGTTRYDMTQLPITQFKPREIGTSVEKLLSIGYTHDSYGNELTDEDQVIDLMVQDVILPANADCPELGAHIVLLKTTQFIDELLEKHYGLPPYYNCQTEHDLVGALVAVLAPHTSATVIARIIGFSKTQGFFAHPLMHAATRRDCDGDEASVTLLMDALLNFSKKYLPESRGSTQDAPLVLTSRLTPAEVDDMAFDVDVCWKYPLEFYEACLQKKQPWEVSIEQFGKRLGTDKQYLGFGFTHDVSSINAGVRCSAYKILPSMEEKLQGQMDLANRIRAVDKVDVARLVIEKHLIRDIRGNLRKFSMQQFRCTSCNEKFRRPPLKGSCTKCNGRIIFTIAEGFIIKYLEPAISLANKYNLPDYLKQNLELTKRNVESLFGKEKEIQSGLGKWF